jgi:SpoVK/Ycf46/Vps4 family AAA+-type ATPase
MAALYNKYIGETERNLRETIKLAEMMAPCVLWLDEIEKGIAKGSHDDGTSRRILGTLLTWMSERTEPVFIVATSNDISGLPPELVRKGRMDEIFFVDLPDESVRKLIFEIHLDKRGFPATEFDLNLLADMSSEFSGAEIEQTVVAALHRAEACDEALTTAHIAEEINATSPIAIVMAEQINQLRQWAKNRTVSAD